MEMLTLERQAAAVIVEAEALEAAVGMTSVKDNCELQPDMMPINPAQHVKEYIEEQANKDEHLRLQADSRSHHQIKSEHMESTQPYCTPPFKINGSPSLWLLMQMSPNICLHHQDIKKLSTHSSQIYSIPIDTGKMMTIFSSL